MSRLDIVVPCYAYGRYLRQCVASVLSQGIDDVRVLVIDDASPDDTATVGAALAVEDARVTFRRHAINQGHIATYNEGIDWCRAEHMLLLSADDHLLPGALQRAMAALARHPDAGLCIGDARVEADGASHAVHIAVDAPDGSAVALPGRAFIALTIRSGSNNVVTTATAIVRTALLRSSGGYRADLPHTADLELWLRLAAHAPVVVVRAEQAVYRRHAANMSTAYLGDHCLTDLLQRQAAYDAFLGSCRDVLHDAPALHAALLRGLAREAVGHASSAFNHRRPELSRTLAALALAMDPGIRGSRPWQLLRGKRLLGVSATNLLRHVKRAVATPVAAGSR